MDLPFKDFATDIAEVELVNERLVVMRPLLLVLMGLVLFGAREIVMLDVLVIEFKVLFHVFSRFGQDLDFHMFDPVWLRVDVEIEPWVS